MNVGVEQSADPYSVPLVAGDEHAIAWVRALGIDPNDVPAGGGAMILPVAGKAVIPVYVNPRGACSCECGYSHTARQEVMVSLTEETMPSAFGLVTHS